jgi:hypothetical protein
MVEEKMDKMAKGQPFIVTTEGNGRAERLTMGKIMLQRRESISLSAARLGAGAFPRDHGCYAATLA